MAQHASTPDIQLALLVERPNFALLRTPLLPAREFFEWLNDGGAPRAPADAQADATTWEQRSELLRTTLRRALQRPVVQTALTFASHSLSLAWENWLTAPADADRARRAERALVRYFERMCTRSAPFGLFAGVTVVPAVDGRDTELSLRAVNCYRTSTRFDFNYLFALSAQLVQQSEDTVRFVRNPSLHRIGETWYTTQHFAGVGGFTTHRVIKLRNDAYLDAVVTATQQARTKRELATLLGDRFEIEPLTLDAYLGDIIAHQVVVATVQPRVISVDALGGMLDRHDGLPIETVGALSEAANRVDYLDAQPLIDRSLSDYEILADSLRPLSPVPPLSQLFQTSLAKPAADGCRLGRAVLDTIVEAADIALKLSTASEPGELQDFRERFTTRYGHGCWVPLLEAIDSENGVGFGAHPMPASPLLRTLPPSPRAGTQPAAIPDTHLYLLQKLLEARASGQAEIQLRKQDLIIAQDLSKRIPDSFAAMVTLLGSPDQVRDGECRVWLQGLLGPSGTQLMGRFCAGDDTLAAYVRAHLREEEQRRPDAVFAEIVYLPAGRIGNVTSRPTLREYELVCLGLGSVAEDHQITPSELLVTVTGDHRILLYCPRLRKEVIPRLTNAHTFYAAHHQPIYRFLGYLRYLDGSDFSLSWASLNVLDHLPRVVSGRIVLTPAQWRLSRDERDSLYASAGQRRLERIAAVRAKRLLPRFVEFNAGDASLPVDLLNILSIDAFLDVAKHEDSIELREMLTLPSDLAVTAPEGHFVHQLIVPFIRKDRFTRPGCRPDEAPACIPGPSRLRAPGGDWCYFKLYGGAVLLEEALVESLFPILEKAALCGRARNWFFVRYADPQPHLRIRCAGTPQFLWEELLPQISKEFGRRVAASQMIRMEIDSYRPEIERYGGEEGLRVAEEIFGADSVAVSRIMRLISELDEEQDERWQSALLGVHNLLLDFGLTFEERHELCTRRRKHNLGATFDKSTRIAMGAVFREQGPTLNLLLTYPPETGTLGAVQSILTARSRHITAAAAGLRELRDRGLLSRPVLTVMESIVHMHVNRMFRWDANLHESILYDFLSRLYTTQSHRGHE